jgi:hypothetical protein
VAIRLESPDYLLDGTLNDVAQSEGISGKASFELDASTVTRWYDLTDEAGTYSFDTHYKYVRTLLGYPKVITGPAGVRYIARRLPHSINLYTHVPTASSYANFLWATKCNVHPRGPLIYGTAADGRDYPRYKQYRFEVTYESLTWEPRADSDITQTSGVPDESAWQRYVTKIAKPAGQFFTYTGATLGYKWVSTGATVETGVAKLITSCNLQITWHQVPEAAVPSFFISGAASQQAIDTCIGKVNNASFNGYPSGTLLLLGVQLMPKRSPFGDRIYDIVYMFKYFQPVTTSSHQYIFKPTSPSSGWTEVTTTGVTNLIGTAGNGAAGVSVYDWANFSALFKPPT